MTEHRLTLTFDNGPTPGVTEGVLDALAERDVPATFFVVGDDLGRPRRRELLSRAREAGHRIGNHTLTHSVLLGRTDDRDLVRSEIDEAQRLLGDLADDDKLFRPWGDGGLLGPHLLGPGAVEHLVGKAYTLVLWNCVPRDWEDATGWPERARATILAQDWTVLVLHDNSAAMDALPDFLDRVRADGVEFSSDLPDACVPIRRGVVTGSLDGLVSA